MAQIDSGGISGAITNPMSVEAQLHAYKYYEALRHRSDDVYKISQYTGYTAEQVLTVKNYLFVDTHVLSDGIRRFDPSFEIAESWQRLADMQNRVLYHDKLLIPHEILEMDLIHQGLSQESAHKKACLKYNYPEAANKYYNSIQPQAISPKNDIISGGIEYRMRDNWHLYM